MKSIKEKAEDIQIGYDDIQSPAIGRGFVLGANYVLDEIENIIKSDRILGYPFPSIEMRYNQIISVIEQLKK